MPIAAHADMDSLSSFGFAAASVAGLTSSLHCFAMCGPLACAGCAKASPVRSARWKTMGAYQGSRVAAYSLIGGLFGLAGAGAMSVFSVAAPPWLPWLLVALLVASALGVGEWMPRIPGISQFLRRANGVAAKFSPTVRAGAMGALTPLLPCGLLYGLFGSALVTGSFGRGALLAGGFAVGGIPALLLAQLQTNWIRRLPSGSEFLIRRVVPLAAALVVAVRALSTTGCPLCP
jgi:sulfite exporter TauE/SafE